MARALVGALVSLALLSSTPAAQQRDTRLWYQAYDDGVRAVRQKDWPTAIASLEAARRSGPAPGRRVLFQGDRVDRFNPDYFLGLAYLASGRFADAEAAFRRVQGTGILQSGDAEFETLGAQLVSASYERLLADGERAIASRRYADAEKSAREAEGLTPSSDGRATRVAALARFEGVMARAENATTRGQLFEAREALSEAEKLGISAARVAELRRTLAESERRAETAVEPEEEKVSTQPEVPDVGAPSPVVPENAVRAPEGTGNAEGTRPEIAGEKGSAANTRRPVPAPGQPPEYTAMVAFFGGDYAGAVAVLTPLVQSGRATPRALLYLACSNAALVITGRAGDSVLSEARAQFARVGSLDQFSEDRRYISPKLVRMLGGEETTRQ
jgi:tetratricopeptide (TPR) repeat protein